MRPLSTIIIAFLLAGLAADIVLALGVIAPDFFGFDTDRMERIRFFGVEFLKTGHGPALAFLLPIGAIVVGEAMRIRSVIYYAAAGALIGFITSWSVDLSEALENTTDIAPITFAKTIATVAGLIGGLVYWYIAERRAPAAD